MVRTRIAPSPTGNCHVGTARTALYDLLLARKHGGTFVLRIDDTDRRRSTAESEAGVLEGLRWLGLTWDEGPDVGGPFVPYRQGDRLAIYQEYVDKLVAEGKAYYCYCSEDELEAERKAQAEEGLPPKYSGKCAHLPARAPSPEGPVPVVRLRVPNEPLSFPDVIRGEIAIPAGLLGDFIILRSDGMPTYNFATVIDEHLMAITHVLRGNEHISNTFPQLCVYKALGWEPPLFAHLNLQLNPDHTKISKRTGAVYVGQFREMGYLPEALINFLALQGWNPGDNREIFTLDELVDAFSLERCTAANAVFDTQKLDWLNGIHIRRLTPADLAARLVPFLEKAGIPVDMARLEAVVPLIQERLKRLDEAPELVDFFFRDPAPAGEPIDQAACKAAAEVLTALPEWTVPSIEASLRDMAKATGRKPGELFMPLRLAVSGRKITPPIFETLAVLGRDCTLARLREAVG